MAVYILSGEIFDNRLQLAQSLFDFQKKNFFSNIESCSEFIVIVVIGQVVTLLGIISQEGHSDP